MSTLTLHSGSTCQYHGTILSCDTHTHHSNVSNHWTTPPHLLHMNTATNRTKIPSRTIMTQDTMRAISTSFPVKVEVVCKSLHLCNENDMMKKLVFLAFLCGKWLNNSGYPGSYGKDESNDNCVQSTWELVI